MKPAASILVALLAGAAAGALVATLFAREETGSASTIAVDQFVSISAQLERIATRLDAIAKSASAPPAVRDAAAREVVVPTSTASAPVDLTARLAGIEATLQSLRFQTPASGYPELPEGGVQRNVARLQQTRAIFERDDAAGRMEVFLLTAAQVYLRYGVPDEANMNNGACVWIYTFEDYANLYIHFVNGVAMFVEYSPPPK